MPFLALQESLGGGSWWQAIGGLLVVLGLLVLCMKLLGRYSRHRSAGQAALMKVMPLGPRREIQVVRLFDTVHFIYRHESGLVELDSKPLAVYRTEQEPTAGNLASEAEA